jgi:hypothetical protein
VRCRPRSLRSAAWRRSPPCASTGLDADCERRLGRGGGNQLPLRVDTRDPPRCAHHHQADGHCSMAAGPQPHPAGPQRGVHACYGIAGSCCKLTLTRCRAQAELSQLRPGSVVQRLPQSQASRMQPPFDQSSAGRGGSWQPPSDPYKDTWEELRMTDDSPASYILSRRDMWTWTPAQPHT